MEKLMERYCLGIQSVLYGDGISYYSFLAIILAEIFYLWKFSSGNALAFTFLLVATFVVICIFGCLKRCIVCTKAELVISKIYPQG